MSSRGRGPNEGHEDGASFTSFIGGPEFFRSLIGHMTDGVSVVDLKGTLIGVNRALCRMTGFSPEELLGKGVPYPYWSPDETERVVNLLQRLSEADVAPSEFTHVRKNGERFPVIVSPSRVVDDAGNTVALLATIIDNTGRKELENALKASEQRWRAIAENPFDFICIIDRKYKVQYLNHTGSDAQLEDVLDKVTPFDYGDPRHVEDMRKAYDSAFATGQGTYYENYSPPLGRWFGTVVGAIMSDGEVTSLALLSKDITEVKLARDAQRRSERRLALALEGSTDGLFDLNLSQSSHFYSRRLYDLLGFEDGDPTLSTALDGLEERLHPADKEHVISALRTAIERGTPFNEEYRLRTKDGCYRWFHGRGRTFNEAEDDGPRFVGFLTDITQRRDNEDQRRLLEEGLAHSRRLETIGTLAGGIAHDFNNLLTPIMGRIGLASYALSEDHIARAHLDEAALAAQRAKDLTLQILTFAKHDQARREPVSVGEVAREVVGLFNGSLHDKIRVNVQVEPNCPSVLGDQAQLQQLVSNLFKNALQALKSDGGTISVHVERRFASSHDFPLATSAPEGECVRLSVRDNGVGMSDGVRKRLFEPFFTTKEAGSGSGLGLSVVHGIVRRHGGIVTVQSQLGLGTTVEVHLPATLDLPAASRKDTKRAAAKGSAKRALCVDDEPSVLRTLDQALRVAGYEVWIASNATQALDMVHQAEKPFDLLVTDYRMPGPTGIELAYEVNRLFPNLPVVLITGYAEGLPEITTQRGVRAVLSKPFRLTDLLAVVERCAHDQ
jgi:PAS domain S-box-containing protein